MLLNDYCMSTIEVLHGSHGRNNENIMHKKEFFSHRKKKSIVPAMQHGFRGCTARLPSLWCHSQYGGPQYSHQRTCVVDKGHVTFTTPITVMWLQYRILDIIYAMALVKRESQLYVSALAEQSAKESDKKRNVKVLDEETYVQVRIP